MSNPLTPISIKDQYHWFALLAQWSSLCRFSTFGGEQNFACWVTLCVQDCKKNYGFLSYDPNSVEAPFFIAGDYTLFQVFIQRIAFNFSNP